jgi:hypothetical protein
MHENYSHYNENRWLSGLEVRRLPLDCKVAGAILIRGGGILKKKNRIRDISKPLVSG